MSCSLSESAIPPARVGKGTTFAVSLIYPTLKKVHVTDFALTYGISPANKEELFNLRHSCARNVIERIFGVSKERFRAMLEGCEYPFPAQVKLISAMCLIHNFIRLHDAEELAAEFPEFDEYYIPDVLDDEAGGDPTPVSAQNQHHPDSPDAWRDSIAEAMWTDYCAKQNTRRGRRRGANDLRQI